MIIIESLYYLFTILANLPNVVKEIYQLQLTYHQLRIIVFISVSLGMQVYTNHDLVSATARPNSLQQAMFKFEGNAELFMDDTLFSKQFGQVMMKQDFQAMWRVLGWTAICLLTRQTLPLFARQMFQVKSLHFHHFIWLGSTAGYVVVWFSIVCLPANTSLEQDDHLLSNRVNTQMPIMSTIADSLFCGFMAVPLVNITITFTRIYGTMQPVQMADKADSKTCYTSLSSPSSSSESTQRQSRRSLFKSQKVPNPDESDGGPPSKRGKKSSFHGGKQCGDCSVWLQLGSIPEEKSKHIMSATRHPGDKAADFQMFLSVDNISFTITGDSCLCTACYMDCVQNCLKVEKTPRWYKLRNKGKHNISNHCPVCHHDSVISQCSTPCKSKERWCPDDWKHGLPAKVWQIYFNHTRKPFIGKIKDESVFCYMHYMEMYNEVKKRNCSICLTKNSQYWTFAGDKLEIFKTFKDANFAAVHNIEGSDWVCGTCDTAAQKYRSKLSGQSTSTADSVPCEPSESSLENLIKKYVRSGIDQICNHGFLIRQSLVNSFRSEISKYIDSENSEVTIMKRFNNSFTNTINKMDTIDKLTPESVGTLLYKKDMIPEKMLPYFVDLLVSNKVLQKQIDNMKDNGILFSDIDSMLHEQVKLFNNAGKDFDFRDIFDDLAANKVQNLKRVFFLENTFMHPW